jgi:hypothetical protein
MERALDHRKDCVAPRAEVSALAAWLDGLLKRVHRLLNPPAPAPLPASGRPRRERDRVPI